MDYINYRIKPKKLDIVLYRNKIFTVQSFVDKSKRILISNRSKISHIVGIREVVPLISSKIVNLKGTKPKISNKNYVLIYYHQFDEGVRLPYLKKLSDIEDDDWSDFIIYSCIPINKKYINQENFNKLLGL